MTNNLIERLRAAENVEERKKLAIDLAKNGHEQDIDELIRMASGEARTYKRILLVFKTEIPYDSQDQLNAIEALGESNNLRALGYLNNLLVKEVEPIPYDYVVGDRGVTPYNEKLKYRARYPNITGELGKKLYVELEADPMDREDQISSEKGVEVISDGFPEIIQIKGSIARLDQRLKK